MDNIEAQNEELLALQSIYDEKYFIVEGMNPPCGRYSAAVQLTDNFCVTMQNNLPSEKELCQDTASVSSKETFQVEFLPPINLYFEFPGTYPSDTPPAFLLSCCWLSYDQLSKLCRHLEMLWVDGNGEVVLFQWIQFLKEETLDFLNIDKSLDITEVSKYRLKDDIYVKVPISNDAYGNKVSNSEQISAQKSSIKFCMSSIKPSVSGGSKVRDCRAFLDIADGKILTNLLKDYNEYKKAESFQNSWHQCDICFTNKRGSEFIIFKVCHHFFCRDCLKSYFELLITEGNVHAMNCPHDKCSTQADGSLVKQIVSSDIFERYDSLLLVRTLETMSDIAYCPRKACQCPLLIDVCGRIGTCPACKFVFCPFCKMAYHGVAPCNFSSTMKQQICEDYLQGDEMKKAELESRHGKRTIKSLVEDVLSEKWIGSNSKHCPHCNASIEKTEGCNKMTCFRCGTYFCWLCMRQLKASNPYSHYSERGSECYEKLFPPDYMDDDFLFEPGAFLNF